MSKPTIAPHTLLGNYSRASTSDPVGLALKRAVLEQAEASLIAEPLTRVITGRRLLSVSRDALERVLLFAAAWQITGNKAYVSAADRVLLSISEFEDWNPSHFLDTAEMTAAAALGYDWLKHELSEESRKRIIQAIIEKGLQTSLKPEYSRQFAEKNNNWNQVCNGGLVLGALAIRDITPELTEEIVQRAIESVPIAMEEYEPDGIYPEGPGYWGYGTSYNILMIEAIRATYDSDYCPPHYKSFLKSAEFIRYAFAGSSGASYNFSDVSLQSPVSPAIYWMAFQNNDTALTNWLDENLARAIEHESIGSRFSALFLLWRKQSTGGPSQELPQSWYGQGIFPICVMLSGNAHEDIFVALKGGLADKSHAHMDSGSFVLDRDGIRWVFDPPTRDYHLLESAGVNELFLRTQESMRWKIWEIGPYSHATLTLNQQLHVMDARAEILEFSAEDKRAVVDLTETLGIKNGRALRTFQLLPERRLLVRDELTGLEAGTKVGWRLLTTAIVELKEAGALLSKEGKTLPLAFKSNPESGLILEKMDVEDFPWKPALPDVSLLVASVTAGNDGSVTIDCILG